MENMENENISKYKGHKAGEPWKIKIQNSKCYWEKSHGNLVTFYCLILFDDRFWGSIPPSVVKRTFWWY